MQVVESIKDDLVARRRSLAERLGKVESHLRHTEKPLDDDFAEQAVERANDEVLEALDDKMRVELEQIDHALYLMEHGKYGICVSCGNAIAEKRLAAVPYTSVCIACAA